MKVTPFIVSLVLATSTFGYGMASAQLAGAGGGTPCTSSYPCSKICGDHPCAPGEVYTPGGNAVANATMAAKTNGTMTPSTSPSSLSSQIGISANASVTKGATGANATMGGTHMSSNSTGTMTHPTTSTLGNMTSTQGSMSGPSSSTMPAQQLPTPAKQVASGTAPADVKCPSGYQLALNKYDQRPACVTADVYQMLVARGWAA